MKNSSKYILATLLIIATTIAIALVNSKSEKKEKYIPKTQYKIEWLSKAKINVTNKTTESRKIESIELSSTELKLIIDNGEYLKFIFDDLNIGVDLVYLIKYGQELNCRITTTDNQCGGIKYKANYKEPDSLKFLMGGNAQVTVGNLITSQANVNVKGSGFSFGETALRPRLALSNSMVLMMSVKVIEQLSKYFMELLSEADTIECTKYLNDGNEITCIDGHWTLTIN